MILSGLGAVCIKKFGGHATLAGICLLYNKSVCLAVSIPIPTVDSLVEQCLNGELSAYRLLYDRYAKAMYNTALRITQHTGEAEDVLQEAFTDAFLQLRNFENKVSFGAWLKQIVVFKSIAVLKKKKLNFVELEGEPVGNIQESGQDDEGIEFTVQAIKDAMKKLPDGYRTVLTLYLLEGYDQEEIADILQVAHSTVRTQYTRGKQKLLSIMKKENAYE